MIKRFGKSSGPLLQHKLSFFKENDVMCNVSSSISRVYATQPLRKRCKNCDAALGEPRFEKNGVPFVLCDHCGHLCGLYEDTDAFCKAVYTDDGGKSYGVMYAEADLNAYNQRMNDIYLPKARFLIEVLEAENEKATEVAVTDIGAGSGYFVAALACCGLKEVRGFEVSERQVAFGNAMMGGNRLSVMDLSEAARVAREVGSGMISLIGVLEHLQNPREVLAAIVQGGASYVYFSVPLFSACVFFEMVFPDVFPRQLSGGHTHLYTEKSIRHFCSEFGFTSIGEWWFGTDFVDLYRNIMVILNKSDDFKQAAIIWDDMFRPIIDDVQLALDRKYLSSEVHMLLRVER